MMCVCVLGCEKRLTCVRQIRFDVVKMTIKCAMKVWWLKWKVRKSFQLLPRLLSQLHCLWPLSFLHRYELFYTLSTTKIEIYKHVCMYVYLLSLTMKVVCATAERRKKLNDKWYDQLHFLWPKAAAWQGNLLLYGCVCVCACVGVV